jgi:FdrA protein
LTVERAAVYPDTYLDSVLLLAATRAMGAVDGVRWATSVMATPANVEALAAEGIAGGPLDGATANDLVLAVIAETADTLDTAIMAGERALFAARPTRGDRTLEPARSLDEARSRLPSANVAIISVPGPFAALEAHKALGAGLHVLLFSDNVDLEEEIELKDRAIGLGRLVMGPGAGTAVLGGCGLGFANVVARGRVGVVAAAGTGAQEVMALLDQWGAGCSQVIGVGGRDLSEAVAGRMAGAAVEALDADPNTDVILLVSKPPADAVARAVIARSKNTPVIAALIGKGDLPDLPSGTVVTSTLEGGAAETLRSLGQEVPDETAALEASVAAALGRLQERQALVHGLFSGGTLCYESLGLLGTLLGPVYSNIPLDQRHGLPAPDGAHVCLDLGEEEYTKGRPHPMIDPEARLAFLRESAARDDVAVILLDVVLGYGAHKDPAGTLVDTCREIAAGNGPVVVAYVLGTRGDPQGLEEQRARLRHAGCLVPPTAARAALAAAALCRRQPDLVRCLPLAHRHP